jgi:hypothetical protein
VLKNWLRRTLGFLRTDVSNFYRSISGITGHPLENQKMLVIYLSLGCWVPKSIRDYFVPFSNGRGKTGGVN